MEITGIVKAICISERRGTEKHEIAKAHLLVNHGIEGDAHAGNWHRQVSLLSYDKIVEFNRQGAGVTHGAFGENLVVEGIDFRILPIGSVFSVGSAKLKMTQIGKECHAHCAIYYRVGQCIMPHEGVFAEVIEEGEIAVGDKMTVTLPAIDRPFTAAVITMSDKGAQGLRVDESGPKAMQILRDAGYEIVETMILPDEEDELKKQLIRLSDGRQIDLIITSGGTGFSKRDRTPEATLAVAERLAPGISEYIRMKSAEITDRAMLSRGVSVIRGGSIIVNLPGSPKAVEESLGFILNALGHGIKILRGTDGECARRVADEK